MVLIFSDVKKKIYKIPYRDSPHNEVETLMDFDYLNVFKPIKHTEEYHIRKPNNENFLFKNADKKLVHVAEKVFTSETNGITIEYS